MPQSRTEAARNPILKIKSRSANLEEFSQNYVQDLSRAGLFIKTRKPLALGTHLRIQYELADSTVVMSGRGRVVWRRLDGEQPDGMGFELEEVGSGSELLQRLSQMRGSLPCRFVDPAGAERIEGWSPPITAGGTAGVFSAAPRRSAMSDQASPSQAPPRGIFARESEVPLALGPEVLGPGVRNFTDTSADLGLELFGRGVPAVDPEESASLLSADLSGDFKLPSDQTRARADATPLAVPEGPIASFPTPPPRESEPGPQPQQPEPDEPELEAAIEEDVSLESLSDSVPPPADERPDEPVEVPLVRTPSPPPSSSGGVGALLTGAVVVALAAAAAAVGYLMLQGEIPLPESVRQWLQGPG
ncbi:MAG: PilZ domain-containing protein [Myxococcales bacterium]|nr:PilZ domain-containing protein [Myxococcales bacterium]